MTEWTPLDPALAKVLPTGEPVNVSRRGFLGAASAGALVLGFGLPVGAARAQAAGAAPALVPGTRVPAFLAINPDGTIRLQSPFAEGGQGVWTAMAQIVGEELDADPATWPADKPYVIRVKAPREGETVIDDVVQGAITVQNVEIDDYVILRGDGTPTYMLAVVVDDHDMGVTHVIRGDDHINNAFRQLVIIRAMNAIEGGWPDPVYGHIPLIHGADGAKLSKRHGALGVDAYRDEMGLLPEAVFNYLLRLGWGHGDEEIISRDQAVEWFDIANVNKGASRFDLKKLLNLNGHYLREADDARLADLVAPRLDALVPAHERAKLAEAMSVLKVRAADLNELAKGAVFLFAQRPLALDEKAQGLLSPDARAILAKVITRIEGANDWTAATLEANLKQMAEELGVGLGKIAQPLRASLTGQATSPGIFDVLVLLGKEESLARLRDHAA